ncbi:MAG: (2Fe-2S)-binding protein [Gemmatimonadetes bacterium]|nr:(2Fe-2S)-binding protein [Gemmatimonadota bacterium]
MSPERGSYADPAVDYHVEIAFTLNGAEVRIRVDPAERLLDVLRYRLGLTGTKEGCAEGECGACTVWIDGLPVDSCLVPAVQARGREVVTIEAVDPMRLRPLLESGATQCGACTPGVVMTALWILDHPDLLETHTVRELMAGNLCRCTGYDGIVEGVLEALEATRDTEREPA